jgi:hypothetical protein
MRSASQRRDCAGTRLALIHRAMGLIIQQHREGMPDSWMHGLLLCLTRFSDRKTSAPHGRRL